MAKVEPPFTPPERIRRFWCAHGRTPEHLTVLHAFATGSGDPWTPEHLCIWYGLRLDLARTILGELAASRILLADPDRRGGFIWNPSLSWVDARGRTGRLAIAARWKGLTADAAQLPADGVDPDAPSTSLGSRAIGGRERRPAS